MNHCVRRILQWIPTNKDLLINLLEIIQEALFNMKKNLTTVMFKGTKAQEEELLAVIEKYRGVDGAMMPILQEAQGIYGYLPIEVQKIIADKTGTPLETIYGVATFYSQFALNPKGEVAIAVCLGTACYVKGSGQIIAKVSELLDLPAGSTTPDGKYSLEATRCIGACGLAPVMSINGEVYGRLLPGDVAGILEQYK